MVQRASLEQILDDIRDCFDEDEMWVFEAEVEDIKEQWDREAYAAYVAGFDTGYGEGYEEGLAEVVEE